MKALQHLIIMLLFATVCVSCDSNDVDNEQTSEDSVTGKWELYKVSELEMFESEADLRWVDLYGSYESYQYSFNNDGTFDLPSLAYCPNGSYELNENELQINFDRACGTLPASITGNERGTWKFMFRFIEGDLILYSDALDIDEHTPNLRFRRIK
jgi:hypothetical protein